jgi:hypothetical protein
MYVNKRVWLDSIASLVAVTIAGVRAAAQRLRASTRSPAKECVCSTSTSKHRAHRLGRLS